LDNKAFDIDARCNHEDVYYVNKTTRKMQRCTYSLALLGTKFLLHNAKQCGCTAYRRQSQKCARHMRNKVYANSRQSISLEHTHVLF